MVCTTVASIVLSASVDEVAKSVRSDARRGKDDEMEAAVMMFEQAVLRSTSNLHHDSLALSFLYEFTQVFLSHLFL